MNATDDNLMEKTGTDHKEINGGKNIIFPESEGDNESSLSGTLTDTVDLSDDEHKPIRHMDIIPVVPLNK